MNEKFWEVAVNAPIFDNLIYKIKENINDEEKNNFKRGASVFVPLGKRKAEGLLLNEISVSKLEELNSSENKFDIKSIEGLNLDRPIIPEIYLKWLEWLSDYYLHPLGLLIKSIFPPLKRKEKLKINVNNNAIANNIAIDDSYINRKKTWKTWKLSLEQAQIVNKINEEKEFNVHLIYGVTGSGKTEVYLEILQSLVNIGKQALILVPEISLTPQLIDRFKQKFGNIIAVIHSGITHRTRTNEWWSIFNEDKKILIGVRSALFCPLKKLGMIILDEEHESSFKQDEKFKYHARHAAVMLGKIANCPVLLGTATPSIESWYNVCIGKYRLYKLINRVENRPMPEVSIVDLRRENKIKKEQNSDLPFWLSNELFEELKKNLENKKQAALFLNRRGMAHTVMCFSCGKISYCPDCAVSLTLHAESHLVCHYCNYHENLSSNCPFCKEGELNFIGLGTELLEKELKYFFPEAKIARADRDEIQSRYDLEDLIKKIERKEIDILVGTQMIAKGLDFEHLNLVGLVLADVGFNLPDFRSAEKNFQLIVQVSGRAGRHVKGMSQKGKVIVQTYNSEHISIQYAKNYDYEGFVQQELKYREELFYPPFSKIVLINIQGNKIDQLQLALKTIEEMISYLKNRDKNLQLIEVLGPVEAPIFKLRKRCRFHLLLKSKEIKLLHKLCRFLINNKKSFPSSVQLLIDIDPINFL